MGSQFDGIEIEKPDELPEFIALDSWAAYFGAKHSETITAVRERTGNPLAQPSAEELAADQMVLKRVLRRLCMESGKSVVIVDQIAARGKEFKEDNEVGQVLPMTAGGLEYFVDVMAEVSVQERDGEIVRVFQVVKSNFPAFEVGFEMIGDATFKDFLNQLESNQGPDLPFNATAAQTIPETLEEPEGEPVQPLMTVQELIAKAEHYGFKPSDIVTVARVYHNQSNIFRLTPQQVEDLDQRLQARLSKLTVSPTADARAYPRGLPFEVGRAVPSAILCPSRFVALAMTI